MQFNKPGMAQSDRDSIEGKAGMEAAAIPAVHILELGRVTSGDSARATNNVSCYCRCPCKHEARRGARRNCKTCLFLPREVGTAAEAA